MIFKLMFYFRFLVDGIGTKGGGAVLNERENALFMFHSFIQFREHN